jgi:uncharacterized Rmd1/YagE family protein
MTDLAQTIPEIARGLPLRGPVIARAVLLGEHLDTRRLEHQAPLDRTPLVLRVETAGLAVAFRYGVVVLFNLAPPEEKRFIATLAGLVTNPFEIPETDEVRVLVRPEGDDQVDVSGVISLKEVTTERLQVIADILAKSLVLGHYETRIASVFDQIEPLAEQLRRSGRAGSEARVLLRHIGQVLLVQHGMVGRVEAGEKPDLLWDHPELDRLHGRLAEEYELRDRDRALDRKLDVISRTVEILVGLVQQRSVMRVEWYVVLLIVAEIVITLITLIPK